MVGSIVAARLSGDHGLWWDDRDAGRVKRGGLLFIQAGVVKGWTPSLPNRRRAGIALILVPAVLILGMIPALYFYRRALAEQARAMQARQQAMQTQQFLESMLTATRPAASASRPSDDP